MLILHELHVRLQRKVKRLKARHQVQENRPMQVQVQEERPQRLRVKTHKFTQGQVPVVHRITKVRGLQLQLRRPVRARQITLRQAGQVLRVLRVRQARQLTLHQAGQVLRVHQVRRVIVHQAGQVRVRQAVRRVL
jgi:hypothetical protein